MKRDLPKSMKVDTDNTSGKTGYTGPDDSSTPDDKNWPKDFVVDGGLKYEFGPEARGVEANNAVKVAEAAYGPSDPPGKTHKYDKGGSISTWPKKFVVDGDVDGDKDEE